MYFHTGDGDTYTITSTADNGTSNLEGYQGNDVRFHDDNGTYINGDNIRSKYVFIDSNLTKTYFAEDGRLLGIVDYFNNKIDFRHQNVQIYEKTYPLISQITDSVGRKITFSYTGNNILLTVSDPSNTKAKFLFQKAVNNVVKVYSDDIESDNLSIDEFVNERIKGTSLSKVNYEIITEQVNSVT